MIPERSRRILLVEDDGQVLFVLRASLRRLSVSCDIVTAQSGSEAYRLLQLDPFDLLITAIRLPGIDGVTLTEFIRSGLHELPVVWVTTRGCTDLREDASPLGVFHCLEKPVEVSVFRKVVQQALDDEEPGTE
jgi:two-component system, NtrC family, response regulator GlrR